MRGGKLPDLVPDRTGQVWTYRAWVGDLVVVVTHPPYVCDGQGFQPVILLDAPHKEDLAGTRANLAEDPGYTWEKSEQHTRVA